MTVKDFVDAYIKCFEEQNFRNNVQDFINNHITTEYVPFTTKISICTNIIKTADYKEDIFTSKKYYSPDTPSEYMLYSMTLVELYTDIRFYTGDDSVTQAKTRVKEFEMLDESGALDLLFASEDGIGIPSKELEKFVHIMQMVKDDTVIKEQNVVSYLESKIETVGLVFNSFMDEAKNVIMDKIQENLGEDLSDITPEKLKEKITDFLNKSIS